MITHVRHELAKLDTSPRALRNFGLLVGGAFVLLGLLWLWRQRSYAPVGWGLGLALLLLGLVAPRVLRPVYRTWMAMAAVMGLVMTTVLLTVLFYLVLTPLAWLARASGHDPLALRRKADSYWLPRDVTGSTTEDYTRQF